MLTAIHPTDKSMVLAQKRLIWGHSVYVSALRLEKGDLLIVASDHTPESAISDYAKR